jgi:hypothetical protein
MKDLSYRQVATGLIEFLEIKLTVEKISISLREELRRIVQAYGSKQLQNLEPQIREISRFTKQRSRLQRQTCIPRPP